MRAKNGIRTRDLHLGKVALYQLSYFRVFIRLDFIAEAVANLKHLLQLQSIFVENYRLFYRVAKKGIQGTNPLEKLL